MKHKTTVPNSTMVSTAVTEICKDVKPCLLQHRSINVVLRKNYASVMNIKEFYEDNIGKAFTGIIGDFARRANSSSKSGSL